MTALNVADLARIAGGTLVGRNSPFDSVSTDSRTLSRGALFVALKGPSFDGHNFIATAMQRGAAAALVDHQLPVSIPQVVVDDPLRALSDFAREWRRQFAIPVVGVTGSNGKTTTKEMIGKILVERGECLVTQGNLNNHIGVPLTLLRLRPVHFAAVIEMGANHQGEIAALSAIAEPTVGIVTNAGSAHLEGFGGLEGVARGKGEMFAGLKTTGTAVINADDRFANFWRTLAGTRRVLTFGLSGSADFRAKNIQAIVDDTGFRSEFILVSPVGASECSLALAGAHNLRNALGAAAAAYGAGATLEEIVAGLRSVHAVSGRLNFLPALHGANVLDDSYNANPSSLRAGIDALTTLPGDHWLVLGDMLELGEGDNALHAEMGSYARDSGVKQLFAVGSRARFAAEAFGPAAEWFPDVEALITRVQALLRPNVTILIKGSRANRLERVAAALAVGMPATSGGH
jgi:UDP-N-acetylmuramoyl-tripeptide--D-alanyl-D-alanine ligase